MTANHRAPAQRAGAARVATAAGALAVTAGLTLATPQAASAAAPNYKQVITDYSSALENFLQAQNAREDAFNTLWNPIARASGGILPTFGSSFDTSNLTKITDLPGGLRKIANIQFPTGVPGVVPNIILPGGESVTIPLPTTMPGGDALNGAADVMDGIFNQSLDAWDPLDWFPDTGSVGDVIDRTLPPLDQVLKGLKFTSTEYTSSYDWGLLGIEGQTWVNNTFLQSPSGVILDLSEATPGLAWLINAVGGDGSNVVIMPEGSLPSGTVWLPMGAGNYGLPLGAELGWWAAAPTADLKMPGWLGDSDTVVTLPIVANGFRAPLGLLEAGTLSANLLLPTANGIYSPVGLTTTNVNTPIGFGFTNANITTGNYAGTNGIVYDSGQNISVLQNPLGIPLPLIYSLGGFNVSSQGLGWTAPSLFGMSLLSPIQIGNKAGPNSNDGVIPNELMPTDFLNGLLNTVIPIRNLDALLGVQPMIAQVSTALGPVYQYTFGLALRPFEELATAQYGALIDGSGENLLTLSEWNKDASTTLADAIPTAPTAPGAVVASAPAPDSTVPAAPRQFAAPSETAPPSETAATPTARHSLAGGGKSVRSLIDRVTGERDSTRQDGAGQDSAGQDSAGQDSADTAGAENTLAGPPADDPAAPEPSAQDPAADPTGEAPATDPPGEDPAELDGTGDPAASEASTANGAAQAPSNSVSEASGN